MKVNPGGRFAGALSLFLGASVPWPVGLVGGGVLRGGWLLTAAMISRGHDGISSSVDAGVTGTGMCSASSSWLDPLRTLARDEDADGRRVKSASSRVLRS